MNRADKGRRFEVKAIDALEAAGYQVHRCVRSVQRKGPAWITVAGDIYGCIDLIAKKRGGGERTRWIQVTTGAGIAQKRADLMSVSWDDAYDSVEIWQWIGGTGRRDLQFFQVYRRDQTYQTNPNDRVYAVRRAAGGRAAPAAG